MNNRGTRKFFTEPAVVILTMTAVLATGFTLISYKERIQLAKEVDKLKARVDNLANLKVGDFVPALTMLDRQGRETRLTPADKAKHLLIVFSPDCKACKAQEDSIWNNLASRATNRGYTVRGISMGDISGTNAFLQDHILDFDILIANLDEFERSYRVTKAPQIILTNGLGRVDFIRYGTLQNADLKEIFSQLDLLS